jgi:soluble calcium-activated nucleotidase 1
MNDWMRNVRRPTSYRVGNTRFSIKPQFQVLIMAVCALFIFIFFMLVFTTDTPKIKVHDINQRLINLNHLADYNDTYPLSATKMGADYKEYRIAMIADLDTDSKRDNGKYVSYVQFATLYVYDNLKLARLFVDAEPHELHSQYSYGDRGMELSELIVFNGRLYTCDDRTGIVFELNLSANKVTPWVILIDGDGVSTNKGFKCEWMAVKNNRLHVGSLGMWYTL